MSQRNQRNYNNNELPCDFTLPNYGLRVVCCFDMPCTTLSCYHDLVNGFCPGQIKLATQNMGWGHQFLYCCYPAPLRCLRLR